MEFRTRYSKRQDNSLKFKDKSLTKQSMKDSCDINNIINRYKKTGILPESKEGFYADVSEVKDYHQSLIQVQAAEAAFAALPAKIRDRFKNNPVEMFAFLQDPKNTKEAIELGMVEAPVVIPSVEDTKVPVSVPKAEA